MTDKHLFDELTSLETEKRNSSSKEIDLANPIEIAKIINEEDKQVAEKVGNKLPEIAAAIDLVSKAFSVGGRLLYFGAGTSGRLGVLDASECPPTFGVTAEQVQGFTAGGKEAMFVAQEGAEDSEEIGRQEIYDQKVTSVDIVCGIAASGRTPYVLGVLKEAQKNGISTIFITTVPKEQLRIHADITIDIPVGAEVIMGSTRMKSATAQKMVLNMLSTGAMIRQGKIYENVMVDLMLTNKKLVERAKRIILTFTGKSYDECSTLLEQADGHVKTALLMGLKGLNRDAAKQLLSKNNGFIRKALS